MEGKKVCKSHLKGPQSPFFTGYGKISGNFWSKLKRRAKKHNIPFDLNIKYIWKLFVKQNGKCALTGLDIYFAPKCDDIKTASLDRINNNLGYIKGNVQWVHKDINFMKKEHTQEDFIKYCKLVAKYSG